MLEIKAGGHTLKISDPRSTAKVFDAAHSYIVMSFKVNNEIKELFLASKHYAKNQRTQTFYNEEQIGANVNLKHITHGTDEDSPDNTMPLFIDAAKQIHNEFHTHQRVLVNCNHGRSRSGTVAALYLMNHLNLSATDAIHIVTEALKLRGFTGGIDINGGYHGTYGEWLRAYKPEGNKENSPNNAAKPQRKRPLEARLQESFFSQPKKPLVTPPSMRLRSREIPTMLR